jgi:hypothetical protein
MALYQFDLQYVSRGAQLPRPGPDGFLVVVPVSVERCEQAQAYLESMMGQPWLILEDWFVFGPENGSRFDLLRNEDGTGDISARIDAREIDARFLDLVCALAKKLNCIVFSLQFAAAIEPEQEEVRKALMRSRAKAYVIDPMSVLRGTKYDA